MNKLTVFAAFFLGISVCLSSCSLFDMDIQKDYDYKKSSLDPHINKTAREYLIERGKNPKVPNDTIFKWMQLGLEYAEIDLAEFEKPGRTFILLKNEAIRVLPTRNTNGVIVATSNVPTSGMWFTFGLTFKNADGTLRLRADGTPDVVPVKNWSDYPKADVRNYFLSLIATETYNFDNAKTENTSLPTLLPTGASASDNTLLGYYPAGTTANLNVAGDRILTRENIQVAGKVYGFDPESKMNIRIVSSDYSPLRFNDITNVVTAGIVATNGVIHVMGGLTYPWRY